MKKLKRLSLSEQVVNAIVQYIQENNLKTGDKLPTEKEFSDKFNVSRTSVREAIKALGINGILKSIPGKGTFLQDKAGALDIEGDGLLRMEAYTTINDVMEVRTPLEIQAAKLAAKRCTDSEVDEIENICRKYEEAVQHGDDFAKWGQAFHERLIKISGNKMLMKVLKSLRYMTNLYRDRLAKKNIGVEYYLKSHEIMCKALRTHDEEMAANEMAKHMQLTLMELKCLADSDDVSLLIYKNNKNS